MAPPAKCGGRGERDEEDSNDYWEAQLQLPQYAEQQPEPLMCLGPGPLAPRAHQ